MVGMPYPNIKSPELQEKMAYLDQTLVSTSSVQRVGGGGRGEAAVASGAAITGPHRCDLPTAPMCASVSCPLQGMGRTPLTSGAALRSLLEPLLALCPRRLPLLPRRAVPFSQNTERGGRARKR